MRTKSAFFTQVFAFTRSGEKILGFGILYLFFAGWVPPSSAAEPGRVTTLMTKALDGIPEKEADSSPDTPKHLKNGSGRGLGRSGFEPLKA